MYLLGAVGLLLIICSGMIDLTNLKPILADGISPVIHSVFTQTLYVPFGEIIVFVMILPYLNNQRHAKRQGFGQ